MDFASVYAFAGMAFAGGAFGVLVSYAALTRKLRSVRAQAAMLQTELEVERQNLTIARALNDQMRADLKEFRGKVDRLYAENARDRSDANRWRVWSAKMTMGRAKGLAKIAANRALRDAADRVNG